MPTACEIAQLPEPTSFEVDDQRGCDGISYLPTLKGVASEQRKHEYLYWASQEGATSVGMRMGNWKLVNYRAPKKANRTAASRKSEKANQGSDDWRLYDLSSDVGEKNDIADAHPAVVKKMLDLLKTDGLL